MINDGAFELLKNRVGPKKMFLKNTYKKFQGVPAIRLRNEDDFLQAFKEHCTADLPFLFGTDSASIATKFYHSCLESLTDPALKEKCLLITADTIYRVKDATEDFKGKFVFYSPKITFGVDFTIDVPQDVFIYISGGSILPTGSYQQATCCRNIRSLYYYGETLRLKPYTQTLRMSKHLLQRLWKPANH